MLDVAELKRLLADGRGFKMSFTLEADKADDENKKDDAVGFKTKETPNDQPNP